MNPLLPRALSWAVVLLTATAALPVSAATQYAVGVDYLHDRTERESDSSGPFGSVEEEVDAEAEGFRVRFELGDLRGGRVQFAFERVEHDFDLPASFEDVASTREDVSTVSLAYLGTFGMPHNLVPRWKLGAGIGFTNADERVFEDDMLYNLTLTGGLGLDYVINDVLAVGVLGEVGARVWQDIDVRTEFGEQSIDTTDTFFRVSLGMTYGF